MRSHFVVRQMCAVDDSRDRSVVVIIDDDEGIRAAFGRLIRAQGYATRMFESADAYIAAGCPEANALVVDINMPGTNGIELTRHLTAMGRVAPVIVVSVDADAFRSEAITAGALAAIPKGHAATVLPALLTQLRDEIR